MASFQYITDIREIAGKIMKDIEIREDEDCGDDNLFDNGLFDILLKDRELPDNIMDEYIEAYKGDPCINVLEDHNVINGVVASKLCHVNYATGNVEMGSRDLDPLFYRIDHDESFCESSVKWYVETFMLDKIMDYPYVQPAQVHIDKAKTKPERHYQVQSLFMHNGYYLFEPTELERKHCDTYGGFMTDKFCTTSDVKYDSNKKVFVSFRDNPEVVKKNYVAMQFNPFHSCSVNRIRSITNRGMVYEGEYDYYGKIIPFKYDLLDKRYRIHSIEWQGFLGFYNVAYEMFDLVSDHDFMHVFPLKVNSKEETVDDLHSTLFIEPFITNRRPPDGYSVLGPWDGYIRKGVSRRTYVPTHSRPIDSEWSRDFEEVTHLTRDFGNVLSIRTHCLLCVKNKVWSDKGKCECEENKPLYLEYSYEDTKNYYVLQQPQRVYECYLTEQELGKGTYIFFKYPGMLPTYPRNGKESIMYEPKFLNLMDFFRTKRWHPELSEFASLSLHRMKGKYKLSSNMKLYEVNSSKHLEEGYQELVASTIYYFPDYNQNLIDSIRDLFISKIEQSEGGINVYVCPEDSSRFADFVKLRDEEYLIIS